MSILRELPPVLEPGRHRSRQAGPLSQPGFRGALFAGAAAALLATWSLMRDEPLSRPEPLSEVLLIEELVLAPEVEEVLLEPEIEEIIVDLDDADAPELADAGDSSLDDLLGLDAGASAGSDSFGLLARRGGRDLIGSAAQSPGTFAGYSAAIERHIQRALSGVGGLRQRDFVAEVSLWVNPEGGLDRIELTGTTGDSETDRLLERGLNALGKLSAAPPVQLPQPVRLRIRSQGAS